MANEDNSSASCPELQKKKSVPIDESSPMPPEYMKEESDYDVDVGDLTLEELGAEIETAKREHPSFSRFHRFVTSAVERAYDYYCDVNGIEESDENFQNFVTELCKELMNPRVRYYSSRQSRGDSIDPKKPTSMDRKKSPEDSSNKDH